MSQRNIATIGSPLDEIMAWRRLKGGPKGRNYRNKVRIFLSKGGIPEPTFEDCDVIRHIF